MRKLYFLLYFILTVSNQASAQNIKWGNVINNTYTDIVFDLQVDLNDNLVICGQFEGTVDFDPGPGIVNLTAAGSGGADMFLAKYDSLGNYLWAHRFGSAFFYDQGDRIAIDGNGNIYFTGMFGSMVDFDPGPGTSTLNASGSNRGRFLAKYDAYGNFLGVKYTGGTVGSLPSSQDAQTGLGCDADGNVYMSGFYGTTLALAPGTTLQVAGLSDNYFCKFDSQLNLIWANRIASIGTEYSQGMFVHPSGIQIQLGSFGQFIDLDPVDTLTYLMSPSGSVNDGYFAVYDSAGYLLHAGQLEAGTSVSPRAAFFDSEGNIIISGSCAGGMDANPDSGVTIVGIGFNDQAFVAKYDTAGNYLWAFAFGDIGAFNSVRYASHDTADNIYISGDYNPMTDVDPGQDTATFGNKYGNFVISFDASGNFRSGFLMQDAKMRMKGNDIYLTGGFYGLVDFDPGPQVFNTQSDTANASWYLLRMSSCDTYAESPGTIYHTPLCAGDTAVFSVIGGGPLYNWVMPEGFNIVGSSIDNDILVVLDSGFIEGTVMVQSTGFCQNSPFSYSTLIIHDPLEPNLVYFNDTLYSSPGMSYQWYLDGNLLTGASDSVYVPVLPGVYTVEITDPNGCLAISNAVPVVTISLDEINKHEVKAYPNPSDDYLYFSREFDDFSLVNIYGQTVFHSEVKMDRLQLKQFRDGLYYLISGNSITKIIISH